jgi:Zn-dependent protease with chaperone function
MICKFSRGAWFAVLWAVVLMTIRAEALEATPSCSVTMEGGKSDSLSNSAQIAPKSRRERRNSRKYDVNRIGQRNIAKGINVYSLLKERSLGATMSAAIDAQTPPVADSPTSDYINQLAQKIVRNSDAQVPFTIKIIDSKNPTTFALPGGFLYVDVGLISEVDNEAELAGLIAHEVAHVAARHATRLATRRYALDAILAFPIERIIGPLALAVRQIGLVPIEKKFIRQTEFEADLLGIEYQYAAGYDPQAYLEALEKLDNSETQESARASDQANGSAFIHHLNRTLARAYSDYPSTESRVLRLQAEISTLLPCRMEYVVDTGEFQEIKARLAADRLILRRRRGDGESKGPVLQRRPSSN